MGFFPDSLDQGPPTIEQEEQNRQNALSLMDPTYGSLPPQTAVKFQAPSQTPKADEEAQLPMVPRGQLAAWIKQKQDEEEQAVPSGQPSAEDQRRADISRAIGNSTASALSGIQNTIGILKPGSQNYNQANLAQQQGEQYAKEALGRAPAARQEAIQNMQLGSMQDEKRQKQLQMVQALKMQQDAQNPESASSKEAQRAMLARLRTYGAVTQNPALKNQFEELSKMVPNMSQARLDALDKQGYIDKLLAQESNERAQGAHNDILAGNAAATNRLGYAQLNEKVAHDRAEEEKGKAKDIQVKVNQDRIANDQIKDLNNADTKLTKLIDGVESGKVDVSLAHQYGQKVTNLARKVSPSASNAMGLHIDSALQEMKGMAPLVQGLAERSVTKSSRYTPQRWQELTNLPEDSDEMIATKFTTMRDFIRGLKQETEGLLHTDEKGNPVETIAANKAVSGGRIQNQANQREANKAVLEDPEKDKALRWAKDHAGDPRSMQILQHYGVQ